MSRREELMSSPEIPPTGPEIDSEIYYYYVLSKARRHFINAMQLDKVAITSRAREYYVSTSNNMPLPTHKILLRAKVPSVYEPGLRSLKNLNRPSRLYVHIPNIGPDNRALTDQSGNLNMLFLSFRGGANKTKLLVTPHYATTFKRAEDLPIDYDKLRAYEYTDRQPEDYLQETALMSISERTKKYLQIADFQLDNFELSAQES